METDPEPVKVSFFENGKNGHDLSETALASDLRPGWFAAVQAVAECYLVLKGMPKLVWRG
jgi:hypothetical protein